MEPLSIATGIGGIIKAAVSISNTLGQIRDAPQEIESILIEVANVKIIVAALSRFIDSSNVAVKRLERAALIQLDDLVAVLTQIVCVFSKLEAVICSTKRLRTLPLFVRRITRPWEQEGCVKLVSQLQQLKTSLSLMLQVMQCESDLLARQSAESLRDSMRRKLEQDSNLASRLSRLDRPSGDAILSRVDLQSVDGGGSLAESIGATMELEKSAPLEKACTGTYNAAMQSEGSANRRDFEHVLYGTRVYDRVRHNDIDARSTLPSSRSGGWSQLSGISLAQISATSVIKLPIYKHELAAFWSLADDTSIFRTMSERSLSSNQTGAEWMQRVYATVEDITSFTWYSHSGNI